MSLSITEHLLNNAMVLVGLAAVDHGLLKPFVKSRVDKYRAINITRWFFLHAFANFFVVLSALKSVSIVVADPAHSMDSKLYGDQSFIGDASCWPLTIIVC